MSVDKEALYREEIKNKGAYCSAAIRDLARLLGTTGRADEAVLLLDDNIAELPDAGARYKLKAELLVKTGRNREAAEFLHTLAELPSTSPQERRAAARQESYCWFLDGQIEKALSILNQLHESDALDMATRLLLEQVKESTVRAQPKVPESSAVKKTLQQLAVLSSGLSPFSLRLIQQFKFSDSEPGWEEKVICTEYVKKLEERISTAEHREKAELLLELAAIVHKSSNKVGDSNVHQVLSEVFSMHGGSGTRRSTLHRLCTLLFG